MALRRRQFVDLGSGCVASLTAFGSKATSQSYRRTIDLPAAFTMTCMTEALAEQEPFEALAEVH